LRAAYNAYQEVFNKEVNAILTDDKVTHGKSAAQGKSATFDLEKKKKQIRALSQSLQRDRKTLSSRHEDVGKLLGFVSLVPRK
jgi:hypothetical protein